MKLVKPQHFLPVHGEYAFLCAHAQLARDIGITNTSVIRNGAFLGVAPKRNGKTVSTGSMQVLGDAKLQLFYNDGNKVRDLSAIRLFSLHCFSRISCVVGLVASLETLEPWHGPCHC